MRDHEAEIHEVDLRSLAEAGDLSRMEHKAPRALFSPIEPVKVSPAYYIAGSIVALLLILLPLLYLALVGALGFGVYYHIVENYSLIETDVAGGGRRAKLFLYVAPILVGVIAIFFMVKPIFAPRGRHMRPYSIERHEAPRLYEIVDQLCDCVGAPRPKRIDLSCDANAHAGFRRGFLSFLGNDLILCIGLPLVGGMRTNELVGVIAHEFGHFTQGGAMRLGYIIRTITGWFARVVYERDAWDEHLAMWGREAGGWATVIVFAASATVWVSRRILWVLMMIAHAFSCLLSRQMEYDADLHEIRVVGSPTFGRSSLKLQCLNLAQMRAFYEGQANAQTRRLAEDLPAHIVGLFKGMPREMVEDIKTKFHKGKTGLFDTHPSDGDRLRRAKAEEAPGVFADTSPASELFNNYPMVCRAATEIFYKDVMGDYAQACQRVPWKELAPAAGGARAQRTGAPEPADIPLA